MSCKTETRLILRDKKSIKRTMLCPHWRQSCECDREVPDGFRANRRNNKGHCWLTRKHSKPAGPLCRSLMSYFHLFHRTANLPNFPRQRQICILTVKAIVRSFLTMLLISICGCDQRTWPDDTIRHTMSCDATRSDKPMTRSVQHKLKGSSVQLAWFVIFTWVKAQHTSHKQINKSEHSQYNQSHLVYQPLEWSSYIIRICIKLLVSCHFAPPFLEETRANSIKCYTLDL